MIERPASKLCGCSHCAEHSLKSVILTAAFILACAFVALWVTHRNLAPQIKAEREARDGR